MSLSGKFIRVQSPRQPELHGQMGLILGDLQRHPVVLPNGSTTEAYGYPVLVPLLKRTVVCDPANFEGVALKEWRYET